MKLGILGDFHLTNKRPIRRTDAYYMSLLGKFEQALDVFKEQRVDYIIQNGDFFDTPFVANQVKKDVITILRRRQVCILCCYGQHDISGHSASTLPNSPLAVLQAAGVVMILNETPVELRGRDGDKAFFYGASFGEKSPEVVDKDTYNILVTHRMVGDRPLYPGQELMGPKSCLCDHPDFNLISVGDYHFRFTQAWNDQLIVNAGAIPRKTISKHDLEHEPAVLTVDTATQEFTEHKLKVAPVEEVFDLREGTESGVPTDIQKFIDKLQEQGSTSVGWKSLLKMVLDERKANKDVRAIIDEVIEEWHKTSSTKSTTELKPSKE